MDSDENPKPPGRSGLDGKRVGRRAVLLGIAGAGVGSGASAGRPGARPEAAPVAQPARTATPTPTPRPTTHPPSPLRSATVLNVADFGAVGDGRTDSTAAIQKALDAAPVAVGTAAGNDVPATTVALPAGRFVLSAPLRLPPNVTLEGSGPSATYLSVQGRSDAIRLAAATNVQCSVRSLGILCNGNGGIDFSDQAYGPSVLGDARHVIDDVVIVEPGSESHGLAFAGTECRINNVTVQRAAGVALYVGGSDHMLQEVTIGGATGGSDVLVVDSSNCRFVDVKVYGSAGRVKILGYRHVLLGLEMQDTGPNGAVAVTGSFVTVHGLMLDSCENRSGGVLTVGGANNTIDGVIVANRGGGRFTASQAVTVAANGGHELALQLVGPFGRSAVARAADLSGNSVRINGMGSFVTAGSAPDELVPYPFRASGYVVAGITGDLTVADPASSLSPAGASDFWAGLTLSFSFEASGAHRLAFGDRYALAAAPPQLSGHVDIDFRYDGTRWRETRRSRT